MYKIYDSWPEIAKHHNKSSYDVPDFKNIDHVVFAGMGGSGTVGDVFSSILSKTNIHVSVVKGYHLPSTTDAETLIVTTSVSGNTAETLSILNSAKDISKKIIAFSSGGKMRNYCAKNNISYINVPESHSPRASFTAFLYSELNVLQSTLPIQKQDVAESINHLENIKKMISSSNLNEENISLNLAEWITDMPMIYYPFGFQAAAIRFKNSLQENTKTHVIVEDVIESCHNGIVSWEKPSNVKPILLQGQDDHIKTKERWKIIKKYFDENKISYKEVFSVKGSILSKLVSLIYLLDYVTIYKAALSGIDPSPVRSIDFVKNMLNEIP